MPTGSGGATGASPPPTASAATSPLEQVDKAIGIIAKQKIAVRTTPPPWPACHAPSTLRSAHCLRLVLPTLLGWVCAEQGAGATALKTLVAYIKNIADNPAEEKFRNINTENKAFKSRVAPVVGAVNVLKARSMPDPCHPAWPHAYHGYWS